MLQYLANIEFTFGLRGAPRVRRIFISVDFSKHIQIETACLPNDFALHTCSNFETFECRGPHDRQRTNKLPYALCVVCLVMSVFSLQEVKNKATKQGRAGGD